MSEQMVPSAGGLDLSTKLAFDRTWVAYERTMLAWVRTATSLITFGFSVYKFFQIIRQDSPRTNYLVGAREFGILLVGLGLASLVLATLEYRQNIRRLEYGVRPRSLAVIVAALLSILGAVALSAMIFHQ